MGEVKTRSFRIDDETNMKIKELAEKKGLNQQDTLALLVSSFELAQGKTAFPSQQANIEQVESYANGIVRMYMTAIEMVENSKELAYEQYADMLTSKDETIRELQKRVCDAEKKQEDVEEQNSKISEKLKKLEEEQEKLAQSLKEKENVIEDKNTIIFSLMEENNKMRKDLDGIEQLQESNADMLNKINSLEMELKRKEMVENEKNILMQENERIKKEYDATIEKLHNKLDSAHTKYDKLQDAKEQSAKEANARYEKLQDKLEEIQNELSKYKILAYEEKNK